MEFYIKNGIISKVANKLKNKIGITDFLHILKQMLTRLNVPFVDSCCPETSYAPMRLNLETNEIEYFVREDNEWVVYEIEHPEIPEPEPDPEP